MYSSLFHNSEGVYSMQNKLGIVLEMNNRDFWVTIVNIFYIVPTFTIYYISGYFIEAIIIIIY